MAVPGASGRSQASVLQERIADGEAFDRPAMLHVLRVENGAARLQRGGHDEAVVDREAGALSDIEAALVRPDAKRQDRAGEAHARQQLADFTQAKAELAGRHAGELVQDLDADDSVGCENRLGVVA